MKTPVRHITMDASGARGAGETPITPDDPDIPDETPDSDAVEPEVDDQPLGPPADLDVDAAPLPGLPDNEPPAAE